MTVHEVFAASNVLIVAGKGGVGKTTVGASLSIAVAFGGYHVLLIELEGYSNLGPSLGVGQPGYEPLEVDLSIFNRPLPNGGDGGADGPAGRGRLEVMQLRPDEALADYLDRTGLGPLVRRFSRSDAVEVVSAAAPGLKDLVVLGKIRQMEQAGKADLIVVDAPASGHAISLLTSAAGMADSTTGGPIRQQADQVLAMLADEARCQVMLVTQPEETPVTETIETAFALEDDVGVTLAPVVVNGLWPDIPGLATALTRAERSETADPDAVAAARYRLGRIDDQSAQVSRLDQELPLPRVHLPYLFTTSIGPGEISTLARAFTGEPT